MQNCLDFFAHNDTMITHFEWDIKKIEWDITATFDESSNFISITANSNYLNYSQLLPKSFLRIFFLIRSI